MCLENNIDGWRYRCPNGHVSITLVNGKINEGSQKKIPDEWKNVEHYLCRTCKIRFKEPVDYLQVI